MKWIVAGLVMSALVSSTSLAVPIATEYFNYGPANLTLGGVGTAVDGWAGPWSNPTSDEPDYGANTNLDLSAKYPSSQYDNSANLGGMAGNFVSVQTNTVTYRNFATPQTGTIWLSAILRYNEESPSTSDHVMLWFVNPGGNNADGVGIRDGRARIAYQTTSTNDYAAIGTEAITDGVYLLLVKVEMDYSGTVSDRISMWIDPTLSGGEQGLGSPTLMRDATHITGSDKNALGPSLLGLGIATSAHPNEGIDAIRVGTTLGDVTAVPEPTTLILLSLGAVAVIRRKV